MKKDTYICKCLFLYQQIVPPRILPDTFVLLPSNLCMQKGLTSLQVLFIYQQLPILPGRFRPSTFGVCELNFRVRHGYG